jgi:rhomboid protease GluP
MGEKKFITNFFYQRHYSHALIFSLIFSVIITLTTIFSWKFPEIGAQMRISHFAFFYFNEWHRAILCNFIHADLSHLLSNLYMFITLSYLVYSYLGGWVTFLIPIIFASLANIATVFFYDQHTMLLGSSTWIYALWGLWMPIYLILNRRYILPFRLVRLIGIGLIILFPTSFKPEVSYLAHFFGFLFGMIGGVLYVYWQKDFILGFEKYQEVPFDDDQFHDQNDENNQFSSV